MSRVASSVSALGRRCSALRPRLPFAQPSRSLSVYPSQWVSSPSTCLRAPFASVSSRHLDVRWASSSSSSLGVGSSSDGAVEEKKEKETVRVSTGSTSEMSEEEAQRLAFSQDAKLSERLEKLREREETDEATGGSKDSSAGGEEKGEGESGDAFKEHGFKYEGPEPTQYGDWAHKGRCTDF
uniref:Uncharacterized protein n=1 Tax=Chromera velia CCMP2878 TaxID=1169474 RepID=A0A0G4HQK9_9ALVE|eukprot:Cvel_30362.t1-p1 / transcript=Cvel_30362.t1 / gene=Cvel_30362 / organism=Chromera_velia_CCMP2878 / gene_product=hypothetical protein / transcript_product=hypothetical protein / location=Cvel_scaffold4316:4784-5484(+) / protein_length=181 / sequence_SO=supercontig / SO=protein_coding / is_pseudo=false